MVLRVFVCVGGGTEGAGCCCREHMPQTGGAPGAGGGEKEGVSQGVAKLL
jgi:hypothetical protein